MSRKPDVDQHALARLLSRVFGDSSPVLFERTPDGVSSQTYRLIRAGTAFFLRVAENATDNLQVDAEVHRRLRAVGARVPDVLHVEAFDDALERSILIMTEIPGVSLARLQDSEVARRVAEAAGVDAARFLEIAVDGFGWIRRDDPRASLRAELGDYASFVVSYMPATPAERFDLVGSLFARRHLDQIEHAIAEECRRPVPMGKLAHGDLDVTQIYCADGCYTGIIDFSELRGAEPEFDLGHFLLHDGETIAHPLFKHFWRGYAATALVDMDEGLIRRSGVLSGFRQLCRWLSPERGLTTDSFMPRLRAAQLANILDGRTAGLPR